MERLPINLAGSTPPTSGPLQIEKSAVELIIKPSPIKINYARSYLSAILCLKGLPDNKRKMVTA